MTTVPIREQVSDIDLELHINRWLTGYTDTIQRRAAARIMQNFLLSIDFTARITGDGFIQIVRAYDVMIRFENLTAFDEMTAKQAALNLISLGETPSRVNVIVEGVTPS